MYLLDTNVLSALRRRERNPVVGHWAAGIAASNFHISVATINEIETGIARQRKRDAAHADILAAWLESTITEFDQSVLPITTPIAQCWARIAVNHGYDDLDFAIAATALEHGLIVVTRNVQDFVKTGVAIYDPFESKSYSAKT